MEKQTSCLEGCPHLVVLFDSITGLCFHKRYHFLSLYNLCVYIHFPTLHINNWQNWLHRLMETSSKAVESSWDRQITSIYLTPKIQDLKYRSKFVPMRIICTSSSEQQGGRERTGKRLYDHEPTEWFSSIFRIRQILCLAPELSRNAEFSI